MNNFIIQDKEGKPVFIGKESPNNRPLVPQTCDHRDCSHMECPQCKSRVDYLLGDTIQACEACYDPSKDKPQQKSEFVDPRKVIE